MAEIKMYELAIVDGDGNIVSRGGIKARRSAVYAWKSNNEERFPLDGNHKYKVVAADDDAITMEEFLRGKENGIYA